jgi:hypothetical protein
MGEEKQINVFLRLESAEIIERLSRADGAAAPRPTPRMVFLALRELRNRW